MKETKTRVDLLKDIGDTMTLKMVFELRKEDWKILADSMSFLNEHTGQNNDMADMLLACLTWGIHQSYEARTGEKFVLRMDRPKN